MRTGLVLGITLAACGGSSNSGKGTADATGGGDANHGSGSNHVDAPIADARLDAFVPDSAPAGPTLKVKNYLEWCTVSIDGAAFTPTSPTVPVEANASVSLVAKAKNTMFEIAPNMWHRTAGDTGGTGETGVIAGTGIDATSTTSVLTDGGATCVWVCCPFSPGGNGCPTTNQCL